MRAAGGDHGTTSLNSLRRLVSGMMLAHGKDIAVGILEPTDFISVRRGPNSEVVILNERVLFEVDAASK